MMRIGYLSDIFPKTSETFVLNEITGLSKTHEVEVFALEKEAVRIPEDLRVTYYKKRLVKDGISSLKAGFEKELLDRSPKEHYFRMIAQYFSERSEGQEILHRHFATNSIAYYLSKISQIPYTITTHAWDLFANERYKHLESVLKNANKVITISEFNKSFMMENMGLKPDKIEVVRMGIDPNRFTPDPTQGDTDKFLSVGRLVEKKGLEYAISAFAKISKSHPDTQYTIIGSGPEEPKLRNRIKELNLEDRVKIKSNLSNEDLVEEYKRAGTFLLPCIRAKDGDMDGIPVVLMEAMAMEKLVISTSVSGIPELIDHRKSGLLVRPKDAKALSEALEMVLSQRVDRDSLSKEARATVIKDFNIEGQVSSMELIFKDVLSGDA